MTSLKVKKNFTTQKWKWVKRAHCQPSRTETWLVLRTKTLIINARSSVRTARLSSLVPLRFLSHLISCSSYHRGLTAPRCQSHLAAKEARIRSAARYTAWITGNSGAPSASGRRRALVLGTELQWIEFSKWNKDSFRFCLDLTND